MQTYDAHDISRSHTVQLDLARNFAWGGFLPQAERHLLEAVELIRDNWIPEQSNAILLRTRTLVCAAELAKLRGQPTLMAIYLTAMADQDFEPEDLERLEWMLEDGLLPVTVQSADAVLESLRRHLRSRVEGSMERVWGAA